MNTGEVVRLSAHRGEVVFLDFWASWCPPCVQSLPAYDAILEDIGSDLFELIAINVDEDPADGLRFLEEHPVSYPVIVDPEGEIGKTYGIRSLPTSFLIDHEGRIVEEFRGYSTGEEREIKSHILKLIEEASHPQR